MSKLVHMLICAFSVLFIVTFGAIIIFSVTDITVYSLNPLAICAAAAISIVILIAVRRALKRIDAFINRRFYIIVCLFFFAMVAVQLYFSVRFQHNPAYDFEAVYRNAITWANDNTINEYRSNSVAHDYFYRYPNNLPATAFLALLFKFSGFLGLSDTFTVATVFNSFFVSLSMVVTSLVCKHLWGKSAGIASLVLFSFTIPFYLCATIFYTDFLSFLYPILLVYLWLKAGEQKGRAGKASFLLLFALTATIGTMIKFTVIIFPIALVIILFCAGQRKRALLYAVATTVTVLSICSVFNNIVYNRYMDYELLENTRYPYTHWIMMGLSEYGTYKIDDERLTYFTDPQFKVEENIGIIRERIDTLGFTGFLKHLRDKSVKIFGDGTYGVTEQIMRKPIVFSRFQQWFLRGGENYYIYAHLTTGISVAMMVLMVISAITSFSHDYSATAFQLAIFGLLLFLLIWEARSRYIINYLPILYLCAVRGLDYCSLLCVNSTQYNS